MIRKDKRDLIVKQANHEILFARRHKEGKISNWHKNESLYFGKKEVSDDALANVDLGRMQEHIHTLLSKIDSPLTFKFNKKKLAQLRRVERLNALKSYDADRDNWDIKDIVGKKQAVMYGRAIYSYFASSDGGYRPHLENVDVYDFLIDPSAGGIDIEQGRYMGRWGVVKDRYELKGNKMYISTEVDRLLQGNGNADVRTIEETNKDNRTYSLEYMNREKQLTTKDKFKFWEWFTTFEGERYYLLLDPNLGCAIRVEKLKDMFESDLWPFWTYAAFPDLTEFWTPSYADYVREIFMAQSKSINQMLDNAEKINKPQKIVDVNAIRNLAQLKYKRGGNYIESNGDVNKAIKYVETPSIQTPIMVFDKLENIQQQASGLTAGVSGVADTDGRATIYEGNQASAADRFGLLNKSYSFGYRRFAKLWELGVREHLTQKIAIDILGPDGIDIEMVTRKDLFKGKEDYAVLVESSNSELQLSEQKKRTLSAMYSAVLNSPLVNQKFVLERIAEIAGEEPEQIRQLLDNTNYGQARIMAEADRDIERILDGEMPSPNRVANTAYKQRFIDYMQDREEDLDLETFTRMVQYIQSLDQVIVSNMTRQASEEATRQLAAGQGAPKLRAPGPAQPIQDVIQQNVQA